MWKSARLFVNVGSVVLTVMASRSSADIINVPSDVATIQGGIDLARAGDEVVVAPGTYNETINLIGKAITARSIDPDDPDTVAATIIGGTECCATTVSCLSGEGSDTVVSGFTITGGTGTYIETACKPACADIFEGGGMRNVGSDPTVMHCVFVDNTAQGTGGIGRGGGVANEDASPTFIHCTFLSNTATIGGGMNNRGGSPVVIGCAFIDNIGIGGGGIYNSGGSTPFIAGCVFDANAAVQKGGAMCSFEASAIVVNCLFTNSSADVGAAMFNGGDAHPQIVCCTFTANTASSQGGAIANSLIGPKPPSFPTVSNCVLWGNTPDEILDELGSESTVRYSNVQGGFDGVGNIDADPMFVDPAGDDYRLAAGSPCIDAADNTAFPGSITTDLDGNPRLLNDTDTVDTGFGGCPVVDMGPFELQQGMSVCCESDLNGDGQTNAADLAIILGNWGPVPPNDPNADLNDDGVVGPADLAIVLGNWGACM